MAAQALSGVAKDLTKMSSKSAIKTLLPADAHGPLFRWVALLTGSKNALKGAGFFLGSALLTGLGFRPALWAMAGGLAVALAVALAELLAGTRARQGQGEVRRRVLDAPRHQRAVGGALLPVRRARRVVRRRGAGVPGARAGLGLHRGRRVRWRCGSSATA
jgi:hypothetical protein